MLYVNPLESTSSRTMDAETSMSLRQKQAPEELEHLFLFTLFKEMRKTINVVDSGEQNKERELFEEMLADSFAGSAAKNGQLGIAKQITAQLELEKIQPQIRGKIVDYTESKGVGQGTLQTQSTLAFARSLPKPEILPSSAQVDADEMKWVNRLKEPCGLGR